MSLVAVLNLPTGSLITLDGCQIVLKRDDFVGFTDLPLGDVSCFRWLTVRARSPTAQRQQPTAEYCSIAVGFAMPTLSEGQSFILEYDASTEEVSALGDADQSAVNLVSQFNGQAIHPERILSYPQVVSERAAQSWEKMTNLISSRLISKRGICSGHKIVPASFDEPPTTNPNQDGSSARYPDHIPVFANGGTNIEGRRRITSHSGTKNFLASLDATQRTKLFMDPCPADFAFAHTLCNVYQGCGDELVGDVQLAFVLFLQISCFHSLEHWRDLVAMLCHVSTLTISKHVDIYVAFLTTLSRQVQTMDNDLFEDVELSGENFLKPSFQQLIANLDRLTGDSCRPLQDLNNTFQDVVRGKLPSLLDDDEEKAMDEEEHTEDGPVVVTYQDVADSIGRSKLDRRSFVVDGEAEVRPLREMYPILAAAVRPNEDVLMTCARALGDASDVSLVREAADYLEEVEASKLPE